MKKPKKKIIKAAKKKKKVSPAAVFSGDTSLALHNQLENLKKQAEQFTEAMQKMDERVQDCEIHLNLLTRLLTVLCVEKFGMRIGVLKRLIKRIEKEAIRDSQIMHLESLYKMPPPSEKKGPSSLPPSGKDPWEDIS